MQVEYKTPAAVQKALRAGKKSTGDLEVSKSAQVPGLLLKDSFKPKAGYWGGRCQCCPKLTQKKVFWPHEDSGFIPISDKCKDTQK